MLVALLLLSERKALIEYLKSGLGLPVLPPSPSELRGHSVLSDLTWVNEQMMVRCGPAIEPNSVTVLFDLWLI